MFEFSQADIQAQVAALPLAFQLWFQWMFVVIVVAPVLFLRQRQGRVALAFSALFIAVQMPLMWSVGLSNLLSLTHLLIWGPLLIYLCRELRSQRIRRASPMGIWACSAVATAIISLVFDVRDFGRWIGGERGIANPPPNPEVPWLWVCLIGLTLAAAAWYVFSAPGDAATRDSSAGTAG